MKKILFLAGNQALPEALEQEQKKSGDNSYSILTVSRAKDAMDLLINEDISLFLVFFDEISEKAFSFLAKVEAIIPDVPFVALTEQLDRDQLQKLYKAGVFRAADLSGSFDKLHEFVIEGLAAGQKGHISGVSLPVALQMIELERKTCTLYISSGDMQGTLYFQEGILFDAKTPDKTGSQAALDIVGWEDAVIGIQGFCKRREQVITEPLTFILMEGARQRDEFFPSESEAAGEAGIAMPPGYEGSGVVKEFVPENAGDSFDKIDFARAPEPFDIEKAMTEGPLASQFEVIQKALARSIGPIAKTVFKSNLKDWAKEGEPSEENLVQFIDLLCIEIEEDDLIMEFREELSSFLK